MLYVSINVIILKLRDQIDLKDFLFAISRMVVGNSLDWKNCFHEVDDVESFTSIILMQQERMRFSTAAFSEKLTSVRKL